MQAPSEEMIPSRLLLFLSAATNLGSSVAATTLKPHVKVLHRPNNLTPSPTPFARKHALPRQRRPPISLNPSTNSLKIAAFSDLHYGENEYSFGPGQDTATTGLTNRILDTERPDFVVLNGDLITGENTYASNSTSYVDSIVTPFVQKGYKWASTYGNHDSAPNLDRAAILREEQKYPNAYTEHGPSGTDGVTNYMIPVYPASFSSIERTPAALMWFFDSRGGTHIGDNVPDWVSNGTAAWFRETRNTYQARWGVLPSIAFVHIPMRAFYDLQQSAANVSGSHYPGLNADVPLAQQGDGAESVPFMQALLDTPGLHSVYSGHDHGDSWCGRWPDGTLPGKTASRPFLCFCKHSGYGGYGSWNRGVRQIEMSFPQSVSEKGEMQLNTWVTMAQGERVTRVSLNETYGQDVYATDDGE